MYLRAYTWSFFIGRTDYSPYFSILNSQFPQFPLYTVRRGSGTLFRPYK